MELNKLCTVEAHEAGAACTILDPSTRKPTDVIIRLRGMDSKAYRKMRRDADARTLAIMASGESVEFEKSEGYDIDALASLTLGWENIVIDGEPFEFSEENCRKLYADAPNVRDQVNRFVGNRANFTQG